MKKFLTLTICAFLIMSFSACKTNDLQQNNSSINTEKNDVSSEVNGEYQRTLIRTLTASEDVSNIENLSIVLNNESKEIKITDSKDWDFIGKYVYKNTVSYEQKNNLTNSQKSNQIKIGSFEQELYLLKDGTIIKQEMCGDSGIKEDDRTFEIYEAEEGYMLNEARLFEMLKKYDNK